MIYFVVRDLARWGIEDYLASQGSPLAPRVGMVTYEELPLRSELPIGSYIFTQRDDLLPSELEMAAEVGDQVERAPSFRLFNHPSRILGRYDLLRTLNGLGLNDFNAARACDDTRHLRFPVFIREERHHTGSLTDLIRSQSELDRALGDLLLRGWRRPDLLVVEFWDTQDEQGLFRKYSAYVVGSKIIPRSLLYSSRWMVKSESKTLDEEVARKELEYVRSNPHGTWLQEVFSATGIEYGRIDYGVVGDRPQAWEINLYPTIVRPSWKPASMSAGQRALRQTARALFFDRFQAALEAIDVKLPSTNGRVRIELKDELLERLRQDRRRERRRTLHHRLFRKMSSWGLLHPLWRLVGPAGARVGAAVANFRRPE
jgi:hypothetical protein